MNHKHSRALALGFGGIFSLLMNDREFALRQLTEAVELARDQRFAAWIGISNVLLGFIVAETDNAARGLAQAHAGYERYIATTDATHAGIRLAVNSTYYLGLLALASEAANLPAEARAHLDAAIDAAQRSGECWFAPELHRLKGEWLLRHGAGEEAEAEATFLRAIHQARQQSAQLWELRASISLGQYYVSINACERAHEFLSQATAGFSDDLDLPDLDQARAMLMRLAEY